MRAITPPISSGSTANRGRIFLPANLDSRSTNVVFCRSSSSRAVRNSARTNPRRSSRWTSKASMACESGEAPVVGQHHQKVAHDSRQFEAFGQLAHHGAFPCRRYGRRCQSVPELGRAYHQCLKRPQLLRCLGRVHSLRTSDDVHKSTRVAGSDGSGNHAAYLFRCEPVDVWSRSREKFSTRAVCTSAVIWRRTFCSARSRATCAA